MGYFPEFHEISLNSPRLLSIIAYKPYPKTRKFYGIVWDFSGSFMGKPCIIMAITEEFMGILWDCMGYSMGIL
jgi:hypothetical protein